MPITVSQYHQALVFTNGRGFVPILAMRGLLPSDDPDGLRLSDGTLVLYYGPFDPAVGGTINLARCPEPAAANPSRH